MVRSTAPRSLMVVMVDESALRTSRIPKAWLPKRELLCSDSTIVRISPERSPMPSAVARAYQQFFVDGEWRDPATNEVFEIRSPHDGTPVGVAPAASPVDVDVAVAAARQAFDEGPWPRMTVAERVDALRPFVE